MPREQKFWDESESSDSDFQIASSETESATSTASEASESDTAESTDYDDSEASESNEASGSEEAEEDSEPARSCTNPSCVAEIEKLQEEVDGYFGHFRKYAYLMQLKEYIKELTEQNKRLHTLCTSDLMAQKREEALDELQSMLENSEKRRAEERKAAMKEISSLEKKIKEKRAQVESLPPKPVPGNASPIVISSDEDTPTEQESEEDYDTDEDYHNDPYSNYQRTLSEKVKQEN